MENAQEKQLKELRKRLEVLDAVIADFERLEAVCMRKAQDYKPGARVRRYTQGPKFAVRARSSTPAS